MTNPLATNYVLPKLERPHFLLADAEGLPLQGQVPITVEQYTGPGNVTVTPTGKEVYYVNSTLASGNLTVGLTSTAVFNNFIGRKITFYVSPAAGNSLIINITGNGRAFRLTGDTGNVATITAGGSATLYFIDSTNVLIIASTNTTTA